VDVQWDAIIVNYNGGIFLDPCLRALMRVQPAPDRIIVVDNASTDDSINELTAWPQAELLQLSENTGYAGGANRGIRESTAPIVVVLNPDVELDADFGRALLRVFSSDLDLGAAGAKLRFPESGYVQHAGGNVAWPALTTSHFGERQADDGSYDAPRAVDYVTGAALVLRRTAFDEIDGFDESFFPAYWEDVDLCFRLRNAGWDVHYQPELTAIHHEGAGFERGNDYFLAWSRNRLRFAMKHLSHTEWWRSFVPAEIERLRGEVSAVESPEWLMRSGGASIEMLARTGLHDESVESVASSKPLLDSIRSIQELPELADPSPRPLTASDGVMRRVKRFLARFSGRLYAEEFYWQQRQFNESVVRAFEAQDRMNRELTVQLLFSLLLIGQHHREADSLSSTQPPGRQADNPLDSI
jgi:O-antigen biosynthesis protein